MSVTVFHFTEEVNGEIVREEFYFDVEDAKGALNRVRSHTWYQDAECVLSADGWLCEKVVECEIKGLTGATLKTSSIETRRLSFRAVEVK